MENIKEILDKKMAQINAIKSDPEEIAIAHLAKIRASKKFIKKASAIDEIEEMIAKGHEKVLEVKNHLIISCAEFGMNNPELADQANDQLVELMEGVDQAEKETIEQFQAMKPELDAKKAQFIAELEEGIRESEAYLATVPADIMDNLKFLMED